MTINENYLLIHEERNNCTLDNKKPLIRLWTHRAKKFLYSLLKHIPETTLEKIPTIKLVSNVIPCVIGVLSEKLKLKINLYDAAIACLWLQLMNSGITEISVKKLVDIARLVMNHKTRYGKIIKILSYIRTQNIKFLDYKQEVLRYIALFVDNIFEKKDLILDKSLKVSSIKIDILENAKRIIEEAHPKLIIGYQRRVVAAAILYAILKHKYKMLGITSADIEKISGLSRFTILRRYMLYSKFVTI